MKRFKASTVNAIYTFLLYSFDLLGNSLDCFIRRVDQNSVCLTRCFIPLLGQIIIQFVRLVASFTFWAKQNRLEKAVNYIGKW